MSSYSILVACSTPEQKNLGNEKKYQMLYNEIKKNNI